MKNSFSSGLLILILFWAGQILSSCSSSQPAYLPKGTGAFKDPYKTNSKNQTAPAEVLTATTTEGISVNNLLVKEASGLNENKLVDKQTVKRQQIYLQQPSRKDLKKLKKRLEAVLDTTKKRDRVTIKTNEKKVNDLKNEVESLKNSVKAEKSGDKVVVSFDKPQTGLSTEAKVLVIVVAVLLLIALLSLPIIGPVLGVVLGIAVVAAALALVLGIVEIG